MGYKSRNQGEHFQRIYDFCRSNGLGFELTYEEASDSFYFETTSAAISERHYFKKISRLEHLLEYLKDATALEEPEGHTE